MERREQAKAAHAASIDARKLGLRGAKRIAFIIKKARLSDDIDEGTLRRVLREGKKLARQRQLP